MVRDGGITPVQAGRYLGSLLGLHAGRTLGGSTEPESPFTAAAHELNERVVRALGGQGSFVVHTEFAVNRNGEPVVLEVAGRAPGADGLVGASVLLWHRDPALLDEDMARVRDLIWYARSTTPEGVERAT